MIAKIVKGKDFQGVVKYVLNPDKSTDILATEGVRVKDVDSIVQSFMMQRELNGRIGKPVCHISLSFSMQDKEKLSNELMTTIALDYMKQMGIVNTQYIIGRHHDKEHPHLHLIYNRVDNNGKTISDKNDRYRSEKICKEITRKYNLYFSKGKENVKVNRLRGPDKAKYDIYHALKKEIPKSANWNELAEKMKQYNIDVDFKQNADNENCNASFSKDDYSFNASKIDFSVSFFAISSFFHTPSDDGLFFKKRSNDDDDEDYEYLKRKMKRKYKGI